MPATPHWPTTAPMPEGFDAPASRGDPGAPAPAPVADHDALRPGTQLDEFEIVRVLGVGGFGIVYLALDQVLQRPVAIKEYMPTALAGRGADMAVTVRSAGLAETFAVGLESFFNEARLLASFDHPSLVQVFRFWKANGTAYMVMPYYPGQTLKEVRRGMRGAPDGAWLRALVDPLLGALELLHAQDVYHRDIAPDNILLLADGRPVLLDFGSARRVIGDRTQSLTAVLKPNFAPVEQYADEAGMRQGPWTDLYALGATVQFMLTGQTPAPAVMRAVRDVLPALSTGAAGEFPGVPAAFLAAIDWTLALAPDDRPQRVAALRLALDGEFAPPPPTPRHPAPTPTHTTTAAAAAVVSGPRTVAGDPAAAGARSGAAASVTEPAADGRRAVAPTTRTASTPAAPPWAAASPEAAATPPRHRPGRRVGATAAALGAVAALVWGGWALTSSAGGRADPTPTEPARLASTSSPPAARTAAVTPRDALPPSPDVAATSGPAAARPTPAARAATPDTPLATPEPAHREVRADRRSHAGAAPTPRGDATPAPSTVAAAAPPRPTEARPHPSPPATASGPQSPGEACGDRNFFSRALCVSRACETPRWHAHPECVEARRIEEQRQRRMER